MEKKMHEIIELGTPGCDYTGGGIWVSYIPVLIDGERAELWLSSEDEECDDPNVVEFSVWNANWRSFGMSMLMQYFDNGAYVGKRKSSPYKSIGKKLQQALKKGIDTDVPFESIPFNVSVEQMRNAVVQTLTENYNRDIPIKKIVKHSPPSGWKTSCKAFTVELQNGQKFKVTIE